MDWEIGAAVGAGFVATAVMTAMLYMGIAMMPRQMTMNIIYMVGSMMAPADKAMSYAIGAMAHFGMGIAFALAHTGLYVAFDIESNAAAWGLLFGAAHYAIVGMGLGMVGVMHPLVQQGRLQAPGAFALSSPPATAMGFLMLHLVYGVLVGVLYEAWA